MFRAAITPLIVVVASLAGCETNPSTGRNQLLVVSAEETAQMGEAAKPELIAEYGGEVKSVELRRYVEQVGRRLLKGVEPEFADTRWEFFTLDSDVINAFALPGGKVFMSRGLMQELNNEAALAGVLGHEIGHVTARHVDERISHAMVVQGIASVGGAVAGSSGWSDAIGLVVGAGGQGYLLKFGRDQESEADSQGLKYMVRAGYDPMGMVDVIRVLMGASEGSQQWEILSTHPDPARRLRDVQGLIRSEYSQTQDNPEYKKFRNRFEQEALPFLGQGARRAAMAETEPAAFLWCAHCRERSPSQAISQGTGVPLRIR